MVSLERDRPLSSQSPAHSLLLASVPALASKAPGQGLRRPGQGSTRSPEAALSAAPLAGLGVTPVRSKGTYAPPVRQPPVRQPPVRQCRFASCEFTGRPWSQGRDRRWRSSRRVRGTRRPRLARGRDRALSPGLYGRCRQNCRRGVPTAGRPRTFPHFAAFEPWRTPSTRSLRVVTVALPAKARRQ